MKALIFFFLLNIHLNQACSIDFEKLDSLNIIRHVYERDIFNVTGKLQYCPSSITVRNISISNPSLKRLSILNVSYLIEINRLNITTLARLLGFAPLTVQLYFQDGTAHSSIQKSLKNATNEQKACSESSSNQQDILRNCPTLKFENDHYILSQTITVAIKRHQTIIDILFTAVVTVLVTVGTLCIGCGLEMEQLVSNFRRPLPLIIGFLCQIVYLPLLSLGISKAFRSDNSTSLGLLSTASSPGMKYILVFDPKIITSCF
jgi:hypothetical protein